MSVIETEVRALAINSSGHILQEPIEATSVADYFRRAEMSGRWRLEGLPPEDLPMRELLAAVYFYNNPRPKRCYHALFSTQSDRQGSRCYRWIGFSEDDVNGRRGKISGGEAVSPTR